MSDDLAQSDTVQDALDVIEREVRRARGEEVANTPWDYDLPTSDDLHRMRERCGLSINDVAKELDYTGNHIRNVENGHSAPSLQYFNSVMALYRREWPDE